MSFCLDTFIQSGAIIHLASDHFLVAWGAAERKQTPSEKHPSFYSNDFFFRSHAPWIHYEFYAEMRADELCSYFSTPEQQSNQEWIIKSKEIFYQGIDSLIYLINKGTLKKGVPYLFATSPSKMTPSQFKQMMYQALLFTQHHHGHLYGCWNSKEGILGITPELLFSHTPPCNSSVHTMALAGSALIGQEEILLRKEKEQKEHHYVIEGITQQLSPLGVLSIGEQEMLRLPTIVHLLTPISLQLKYPFCFETMVSALHPTPALGAFPKKEGSEWLRSYDQEIPRGYFGSPFGLYDKSKSFAVCYVAIRNVEWNPSYGMKIGAGCGIVLGSVHENEFTEVLLKIETIKKQLGLNR